MAFTWSDIQVGDRAYDIRMKLNSLGTYSSNLVKILNDISIPVSSWVDDSTYNGYSYKTTISDVNITSNSFALILFSSEQQLENNFSGGETNSGSLTIYAVTKPTSTITIPSIVLFKGVM